MSRATTMSPGDRVIKYTRQTGRTTMTGPQLKRWRQKRYRWNLTKAGRA